jgi:hypothetical protein
MEFWFTLAVLTSHRGKWGPQAKAQPRKSISFAKSRSDSLAPFLERSGNHGEPGNPTETLVGGDFASGSKHGGLQNCHFDSPGAKGNFAPLLFIINLKFHSIHRRQKIDFIDRL